MDQNNQNPQQNNPNTSNSAPMNNPAPAAPAPQQPKPAQPQKAAAPAPKQGKKNLIISGAIIVVVLALLLVVPHIKKSPAGTTKSGDTTSEVSNTDQSISGDTKSAAQPRSEALVSYEGKMITVGEDCTVTPATQTQTAGTTILINNEGTMRHVVTVGPKSYTVSGLHYTLSWLNLTPGTLMITCDGKDTGSTIDLQ